MVQDYSNEPSPLTNTNAAAEELFDAASAGAAASIKDSDVLQKQKLSNEKTKVELRKKRFQESLAKNRALDSESHNIDSNNNIMNNNDTQISTSNNVNSGNDLSTSKLNLDLIIGNSINFQQISEMLLSGSKDLKEIFEIVQKIRKILSHTKKTNNMASNLLPNLVNSPFLHTLTQIMDKSDNDELNYEITWIFINVAAGTTEQAVAIIECGAMKMLIQKIYEDLRNKNENVPNYREMPEKIKGHILWIFSNVIGDGPSLRDKCLELEILPLIHSMVFDPDLKSQTIKHYLAWMISNILRPTKQQVNDEIMYLILDMLERLINCDPDKDVIFDLIWSLFYIQSSVERRAHVIHRGFHKFLLAQLDNELDKNQKAASRALSTLTITENNVMQILLDSGYIDRFAHIFETKSEFFKLDCLLAFGNIAIGEVSQKRSLVQHSIFNLILSRFSVYSERLQREICFIVANLICTNDSDFLKELFENFGDRLYPIFSFSISTQSADISLIIRNLTAAYNLLSHQSELGQDFALMMEQDNSLEAIENFQSHQNDEIYKKSTAIIKNFFSSDEVLLEGATGTFDTDRDNDNNLSGATGNRFNF